MLAFIAFLLQFNCFASNMTAAYNSANGFLSVSMWYSETLSGKLLAQCEQLNSEVFSMKVQVGDLTFSSQEDTIFRSGGKYALQLKCSVNSGSNDQCDTATVK